MNSAVKTKKSANRIKKIHIGNIIKQTLKEKDLSMAWLARQVCYEEGNFCKKLKKNLISKELLYDISDVLHVDFFVYYSEKLHHEWLKSTINYG